MANASFDGQEITFESRSWTADHPIAALRVAEGVVAVIYDYMAGPQHQQFRNLQGFDARGNLLWTAEHPTNETADAYVNFGQDADILEAHSFAGYVCRLDPKTGKLVDARFTK